MRIALPIAGGRLCLHFGHSESFALVDVDRGRSEILSKETVAAPEHQPGLLPTWLQEHGADLVIAGGMGSRAQALFRERGIDVITGAPAEEPERVVRSYLAGSLVTGENVCDH
jgi:predicted Fe-Mo cluster-binding NifX family protein